MRRSHLALLLVIASLCAAAQSAPRRVALVVGNGAYAANPLKNPINDAGDIAAALTDCGFELSLVKNADPEAFSRAIADFSRALAGAETGLFYYAGHGVQVEGFNYLIPVGVGIEDEIAVKTKALSVDAVVARMEKSGVKTALLFLDSCRDNPFPGSSRSAARGLAVIAVPRTTNSLIAYATGPGEVAQDGAGRNGVFSGAMVAALKNSGVELSEMMRSVKASVAAATGGKQQPRVDDGMKEPFFFTSPELLAEMRRAQSDKAAAELAEIERDIAEREGEIAAERDKKKKDELLRAQTVEKAKEAQKQQEAAIARDRADKAARDADKRRAEEADRLNASLRDQEQIAALKSASERRRRELERLGKGAEAVDELMASIDATRAAIDELESRYAASARSVDASVRAYYSSRMIEAASIPREAWESDAEYKKRVAAWCRSREGERDAELAAKLGNLEKDRKAGAVELKARLDAALATLESKRYTLAAPELSIEYGRFDPEKKAWPVRFACGLPSRYLDQSFSHGISKAADIPSAYGAIDKALKAKAIVGEVEYRVRAPAPGRYEWIASAFRARDLARDMAIVFEAKGDLRLGNFGAMSFVTLVGEPRDASLSITGGGALTKAAIGGKAGYLVPAAATSYDISGCRFDYAFARDGAYEIEPIFPYGTAALRSIPASLGLEDPPAKPTLKEESYWRSVLRFDPDDLSRNIEDSFLNAVLLGASGITALSSSPSHQRSNLIWSTLALYTGAAVAYVGIESSLTSSYSYDFSSSGSSTDSMVDYLLAGTGIALGGSLLSNIVFSLSSGSKKVDLPLAIAANKKASDEWTKRRDAIARANGDKLAAANANRGVVVLRELASGREETVHLAGAAR